MRHLEDVEVNFDGITYAKGASVLKQLVAYVGREPFVAALREYFRKHAWANTTLADLLGELETASGRELGDWSRLWLETAGVNTLRPVFEVDADGTLRIRARDVQTGQEARATLQLVGVADESSVVMMINRFAQQPVVGEQTRGPH